MAILSEPLLLKSTFCHMAYLEQVMIGHSYLTTMDVLNILHSLILLYPFSLSFWDQDDVDMLLLCQCVVRM